MPVFENILFPVDFSERSAQAARYVAGIARKFNGKVTLLHAIGIYDGFHGADLEGFAYAEWQGWMRGASETQIAEFGHPCLDPFVTARVVEDGEPAAAICNYAEEHPVDLIVMPTHGRGVFRRLLLGSVTSKVLHDTGRPVWTLAHVEDRPGVKAAASAGEVRKIVCAVDLTPETLRIVKGASVVASLYGASIRLVHALPPAPIGPESYTMDRTLDQYLRDEAETQIAGLQEQAGTAWEARYGTGSVATVVSEAASEFSADLVIIGRGHIQGALGRLRSNANAIIRESPCPVLSF